MAPKPRKHSKNHPSIQNKSTIPFSIQPRVRRFFYVSKSDVNLSEPQTFNAQMFLNDKGKKVTKFPNVGQNGYVNLYINGLLQEGCAYCVNVNTLTIKGIGGTIHSGTPIIIEMVKFRIS